MPVLPTASLQKLQGGGQMGVYQKYKKNGKHYGPWFVKYPYARDPVTGKIKYRIEKVGPSKKQAEWYLKKKQLEFIEKDKLGFKEVKKVTFEELVDWYLKLPIAKKKRSYDKDIQRSRVLKENFGHFLAEEIKPSMIEAYQEKRLNQLTKRGTKTRPATVNRELALMKRIYNLAIRDGLVDVNPCFKVQMLPENNKRDRVLSKEEYEKLMKELAPWVRPIVKLAYYRGMRLNEILNLTWDKVNLKEGYIKLLPEDTKTGKGRIIPLGEELKELFKELKKVRSIDHNYVFIHPDGSRIKDIRKAFEGALKRAGIKDFHFHDLRHTFVTNMRKAGVERSVIMAITGHKTESMFLRYNTVDKTDIQIAVKKLDMLLKEKSICSQCAPDKLDEKLNFQKLVPGAGIEPARGQSPKGF